VGADADPDAGPEWVQHRVLRPGVLLLCSDGLWNYATRPEDIAELVLTRDHGEEDALGIARRLVAYALSQGGRDNITAAVWRSLPLLTTQQESGVS
jgi:PPM family protein phosphatase